MIQPLDLLRGAVIRIPADVFQSLLLQALILQSPMGHLWRHIPPRCWPLISNTMCSEIKGRRFLTTEKLLNIVRLRQYWYMMIHRTTLRWCRCRWKKNMLSVENPAFSPLHLGALSQDCFPSHLSLSAHVWIKLFTKKLRAQKKLETKEISPLLRL